jgi:hypothetical protein
MNWWRSGSTAPDSENRLGKERRKEPRISGQFKVRYSGTDEYRIVIGHAKVVDLSRYGFGLKGGRNLKQGMELALFLELPDTGETLCIPQAHVSWIHGNRFGVELRAVRHGESLWLGSLTAQC